MFVNPLLFIAVGLTLAVAVWGIIDTAGLTQLATDHVRLVFRSRGWFVMLTALLKSKLK